MHGWVLLGFAALLAGCGGSGSEAAGGTDVRPRAQCTDDGNQCTIEVGDPTVGPIIGNPLLGTCQHVVVADGTGCGDGAGTCQEGVCVGTFACTEDGIRDAIAVGGGPHTFDCDGPTTIHTEAELVIRPVYAQWIESPGPDVVLDGEGRLTIDANDEHSAFATEGSAIGELRGLTITRGRVDHRGHELTIIDSTVSDSRSGGIDNRGAMTLINTTVTGNQDAFHGGGISNYGGTLTLIDSRISGNVAGYDGGGIDNTSGEMTLVRTVVSGNASGGNSATGSGNGGGICSQGSLTLIDSTITDNHTFGSGGGIAMGRAVGLDPLPARLVLLNSTIARNTADGNGGGISKHGRSLIATNVTISGNHAALQGGGVFVQVHRSEDQALIAHATISRNLAGLGGSVAILDGAPDSVVMRGSLLDGDCQGDPLMSVGGNVESPGSTCAFGEPSDRVQVPSHELLLLPLTSYGGPTATHALLDGSSAADLVDGCLDASGGSLVTDQRGEPRDATCDAGAFEL